MTADEKLFNVYRWIGHGQPSHELAWTGPARNAPHAILTAAAVLKEPVMARLFARADDADNYKEPTP